MRSGKSWVWISPLGAPASTTAAEFPERIREITELRGKDLSSHPGLLQANCPLHMRRIVMPCYLKVIICNNIWSYLTFTCWILTAYPGNASGKELICQCRRHKRYEFNPRVGKIPRRRKWQLTPIFLHGESHGQRSLEAIQSMGSQRVSHDRRDLAHRWCSGGGTVNKTKSLPS